MNSNNFINRILKNKNIVTVVGVFVLTVIVITSSYAAFFSVKTNTGNQTVTTGTLAVSYTANETALKYEEMQSLTDEEALKKAGSRIIYVQNTGTVDATYTLDIGYDMVSFKNRADYSESDKLIPIEFVRFAVYEYDAQSSTSTLIAGPLSIDELPIVKIDQNDSNNNRYGILVGHVGAATSGEQTKTYQIKIWLSDKSTPVASNSYFYVNTKVIASAAESKMVYNLSGSLKNENNIAVANAKISLQNGSITTTTNSNGEWILANVPVGMYNLDITANNIVYSSNVVVKENKDYTIVPYGNTFTPNSKVDVYSTSYTTGTTISKIKKENNITELSNDIRFQLGNTYNLSNSFLLNGGVNSNVNGIKLSINTTNKKISMLK